MRKPSKRTLRRETIEQKVMWFHGDSDEVYGSPRILADLRSDGEIISRKTVATTMRRLGLVDICPKRWKTTTIIDHADAYPVDAVKREWDTGALNQVWVGDITYLRTWEGWIYLATVIDSHSRRVIGWAIADPSDLPQRPRNAICVRSNHRVRGRSWHHPIDGIHRHLLG
ncbi:IS3 family transposase [Glaciihabitans sp. UYNi722]|uniref:DDE-type integrase/transposase/recombinase n=1 Tax=Glaciihabitans sp. UYNi722 TaxID=3156344 RepID=UPI0033986516